jgi:hypothetical protein
MKGRHRSQYLVNEPPIPLYPSLAVALDGSDRALILQQLNYWLTRSTHFRDGRYWVYNTHAEWQEQFPWMSLSTVRRILLYLEEQGLVVTANYNRQKTDRTKWYAIDDAAIGRLLDAMPDVRVNIPSAQNEQWAVQSEQIDLSNLDQSVPETTPETNQETGQLHSIDRLRQAVGKRGLGR